MKRLIAAVAATLAINVQAGYPVFNQYGDTIGFDSVDVGLGVPLKVRFVDGTLEDAYGADFINLVALNALVNGVWKEPIVELVNVYGAAWLHQRIDWQDSRYIWGCYDYCNIRALKSVSFSGFGFMARYTLANQYGVDISGGGYNFISWGSLEQDTRGANMVNAVWSAQ